MRSLFRFFPKKTARRFIINQLLFFFFFLAAIVLSLRYYLTGVLSQTTNDLMLASKIDTFVMQLCWVMYGIAILYSLWVLYRYFYPLGRILAKSRSIRKGTYKKQWDEDVEPGQDVGEWYELELTLNKINRELNRRKLDSKQKQIELESLAGAVSDGIIAIDPLKSVRYFNGKMALILGKEFDPLSPPAFLDEVFRAPKLTLAVDKVIETGVPERIQIQMRPHKVMENHVYDVVVSPVKHDKKQKYFGAIAVFNDITDFKKTEDMRIDFVANASHELKTPLTSIKGFMGALERDLQHNEVSMAKDKMQVINKNVSRLNDLVKDLLELSRIDASDDTVKEDVDVEPFTEEMIRELRPLWQAKNHRVVAEYNTQLVKANRVMLGQVLSNLMENAIKYCDNGSHIEILWSTNETHTTLKVIDSGAGVSSEHLSRLFERFYRVQKGKTKSGVIGTGLGLSIVKNCMLKHRGYVEVDSLPGKGTTFTCFFPKS